MYLRKLVLDFGLLLKLKAILFGEGLASVVNLVIILIYREKSEQKREKNKGRYTELSHIIIWWNAYRTKGWHSKSNLASYTTKLSPEPKK